MAKTWQTIRVFVSSTFRDMHAERDYLNRFVFPELRSRCLKRGVEFVGIDLRWGVTEKEAQQRGNLSICLEEIERCRPFFVCLLGDRFGWVPPPEEIPAEFFENVRSAEELMSGNGTRLDDLYRQDKTTIPSVYRLRRDKKIPDNVTNALIRFWEAAGLPLAGESITTREILRAAFEEGYPQSYPLFYLRKSGLHRHPEFPRPLMQIFEEQNPSRKTKLNNLKRRIQGRAGEIVVREYDAKYAGLRIDPTFLPLNLSAVEREALKDGVIRPEEWQSLSVGVQSAMEVHGTIALTGMEELGQQILEDLWAVVESELEKQRDIISVYAQDRAYHERFIVDRTRLFFGREELLKQMLTYVTDTKDRHPLVITGQPGCGKSALMAECARQCREQFSDALVLPHFIGASPNSIDLTITIRSLCETLRRDCALQEELPVDPQKLRVQLPIFLEKAGAKRPIILLLDAINQLDSSNRSHELSWFPFHLPAGVRAIVSTLTGDCLECLHNRVPNDHILEVPFLPEDNRKTLVHEHLALRRKKLDNTQLFRLLDTSERPDAGLPLYLIVALDELCLFGDYDVLTERIDRLPPTLPELFEQVLGRLEHDHGTDMTESICRWLAVSRSGLFESEILELLGDGAINFPRVHWTRFYRALEFYLRPLEETTGAGLLGFFHDQLRFAVYRRYFDIASPETEPTETYHNSHRRLAIYFRSIACEDGNPPKWRTDRSRGLSELPYHQTRGAMWPELEQTLCDLLFIEAKCAAGMTYELIGDYAAALDALPEAQKYKQKEHEREERIASFTQRVIAYAKAWSEARDRQITKGEFYSKFKDIQPPEPLPSIWPWSDEAIEIEAKRFFNNPTRRNKIQAFSHFVNAESQNLFKFVDQPGYSIYQHAYNKLTHGPVSDAAELVIYSKSFKSPAILSQSRSRPIYNAHPVILRTLESHSQKGYRGIYSVSISWDGRLAVSGSSDETVRLWDIENGQCLQTLMGHSAWVVATAITADGRIAGSGGFDKTLRIWDITTGQCLHVFEGHLDTIRAVAITPDGRFVFTGSEDKTVRVWDIDNGKCLQILNGCDDKVWAIAVSIDSQWLVSGENTSIRVWDLSTGDCVRTLHGHNDIVNTIAISSNSQYVVSGSRDKTLRLWDLKNGRCIRTLYGHLSAICGISATADTRLAISVDKGTLRVWDLETGHCIRNFNDQHFSIESIASTPDGKIAITGSTEGTLKIWDIERGSTIAASKTHFGYVHAVAVTTNCKTAISGGSDTAIRVWDIETEDCTQVLHGHKEAVKHLSISFNDDRIISVYDDKTIRLLDINTGKCLQEARIAQVVDNPTLNPAVLPGDEVTYVIVMKQRTTTTFSTKMTPDGEKLFFSREETFRQRDFKAKGKDGIIRYLLGPDDYFWAWDVARNYIKKQVGTIHEGDAITLTPDGRHVVVGCFDHYTLRLWDIEKEVCVHTMQGHLDHIRSVAVTPDSHLAVTGSEDNSIRIWELNSGKCLNTLLGHSKQVTKIAITPDGRKIISASFDNTIRIWDIKRGLCLTAVNGHISEICNLTLFNDGLLLAAWSRDNSVRIWETNTGRCLILAVLPFGAASLAIGKSNIVIGGHAGNVLFYRFQNISTNVPRITVVRIYRFEKKNWDQHFTAKCVECGHLFIPPISVLNVIKEMDRKFNLSRDQSPCMALPPEAWDEPRLLSECPNCHNKLKFNPFIVDNRDRY